MRYLYLLAVLPLLLTACPDDEQNGGPGDKER